MNSEPRRPFEAESAGHAVAAPASEPAKPSEGPRLSAHALESSGLASGQSEGEENQQELRQEPPSERTRADGKPFGVPVASQGIDALDELGDEDLGFKPLDREEAKKLRATIRSVSPWAVLGYQCATGVVVAALAWMLTGQLRMAWSAAYGALAVVIPAALFARGLSRQRGVTHGGAVLTGLFVWELVKIVLTVVMLFIAPRLIPELSWLALFAGFVVTMKVYWAAMWFGLASKSSVKKI